MHRSVLVPLFALSACAGTPDPAVDPIAELGIEGPELECLQQECGDAADADALGACRDAACAHREDQWTLVPTRIQHEGETVFVQASLAYEAGGYGPIETTREREAFVGVTAVTSQGEEIDLAVTSIFPDTVEQPFFLSSEVGPDVRDVIFGVWDHKVAPCDSERMGCKEFGFLLDGSLATWPPTVYVDGTRQRIPPHTMDVHLVDGGAGAAFEARADEALASLRERLAVFGSAVGTVSMGPGDAPAQAGRLVHADDHDRLVARQVAGDLSGSVAFQEKHEPGARAAFVVVLPGTARDHAAAVEACGSKADDAYKACVTALGVPE